jgi:GDP-L-fucose synthase
MPTNPDSAIESGLSPGDRIFVAGHRGMVGSALLRRLAAEGYTQLVTRSHAELDLTDPRAVRDFFRSERIDAVFLAAARVGGIVANSTYPAEFIYQNTLIQANTIHAACRAGVGRLLFLGSSCIYPKHAPQPMVEEHLLSGYLEPTNAPYALAKIGGIVMCEAYNRQYGTDYRAVMPTNLYGPGDNFDLMNSHVLPAMIRKFHLAKLIGSGDHRALARDIERFGPVGADAAAAIGLAPGPAVTLWGSGAPRREFLHVDDLAAACLLIMRLSRAAYDGACAPLEERTAGLPPGAPGRVHHINVGCGEDLTIRELARKVMAAVGFAGEIRWDASRPDGMARKLLDTSRITRLGWRPAIDLDQGIARTYAWYREQAAGRGAGAGR